MRWIEPRIHGVLDYLFALTFLVAPSVLAMEAAAETWSYTLGAFVIALAMLTRMPYGFIRVIPFRLHGITDFAVAIVVFALPWLAGFAETDFAARNFFMTMGALGFIVWSITDWRRVESVELAEEPVEPDIEERRAA